MVSGPVLPAVEWSGARFTGSIMVRGQVYRCFPSSADVKNEWKFRSIAGLHCTCRGILNFQTIMNGVFWDEVPFSVSELEMST